MDNLQLEDLGLQDIAEKHSMFREYLDTLPQKFLGLGIRALIMVILLVISYWLIRALRKILRKALQKSTVENGSITFIDSCVKIILYTCVILSLIGYFGIDAASVVAILGSIGLTIGLAFQGSLSNFAGGVLILICKPFVTGDYILEKNTMAEGTVTEITLFYTKIRTPDNRMISIPNSVLSNATIIDASALLERRVDLFIPVSYETKIEYAREVILKILDQEKVLKHDRQVFVEELANSNVVLGIQFYVHTTDYLPMKRLVLEQIKTDFDSTGITIPFEQIDVHMV
ncbi:MAG: mechanosensitive ion channel family protein [Lachnospiraceae bacterium]|nr:mechanosensitive ion channel family protein [Lachnospiraceae bacterium]